MTIPHLFGSITALLTPFSNGKIDEKKFQEFVNWQINEGTNGLVPCGTTGECPTLTDDEHKRVIELCREATAGRVPVIAGCGSNATHHAIHLTKQAESAGADAALIVVPYYNKPTQEGLYQHYAAIHDATRLPIIIYNIPSRSVVNMTPETMARLAELPRIIGVKDSSGDITRPVKMRTLLRSSFCQLSGDDAYALPFLAEGGVGCISVVSNVAPALCAALQKSWRDGDHGGALKINEKLTPLYEALFVESSPQPVKYAASLLGLCRYELRLPLVPLSHTSEVIVEEALSKVGLWSRSNVKQARAS